MEGKRRLLSVNESGIAGDRGCSLGKWFVFSGDGRGRKGSEAK
jgi:hypothetical protein